PGHRAITVLRAVVLAFDDDAARFVDETHSRLGLVHVLATGPARPHDLHPHIFLVDLDLDAVVDHRIDDDAGKGRMPARVRIEGRDAHKPMHAVFALEPAIGVVALDRDGRRLDAGALAFAFLDPIDLVAVLLRPAHIHAHQHAGPILALGATGTR